MDPPPINKGSDWEGSRDWDGSYIFNTTITYKCPIDYHIKNASSGVLYLEQDVTCMWERHWSPDLVQNILEETLMNTI